MSTFKKGFVVGAGATAGVVVILLIMGVLEKAV